MSEIRLLIDEDVMDHRFVGALKAKGVDVTTVGELSRTGFSDEEQLTIATEQQRAFYTFNVGDFCQLHTLYITQKRTHSGIIISSQDYSLGEQMRRVLKLMATKSAQDMENQLVFLSAYLGE
ncbi:DUF5615 family PIN-like protein [Nodularia sp. UHCC 0506]|uniref:DUF5615 family PIN-like protein n=1 Tax=Nodularia sp. UHCC 0506 TaxID=3110243 RepID=UPI002B21BEAF|nr:DUF5615 family PIN-like protein [Nodularia sp. UHCC 0506]MEA5514230.1 DUF5615 family PIN-like protein [Nodularia sp. UHCC 0506]